MLEAAPVKQALILYCAGLVAMEKKAVDGDRPHESHPKAQDDNESWNIAKMQQAVASATTQHKDCYARVTGKQSCTHSPSTFQVRRHGAFSTRGRTTGEVNVSSSEPKLEVHPADIAIAKALGTTRGLLHHDTLLVEMRSKSKLLIVDFDQSVLLQQVGNIVQGQEGHTIIVTRPVHTKAVNGAGGTNRPTRDAMTSRTRGSVGEQLGHTCGHPNRAFHQG